MLLSGLPNIQDGTSDALLELLSKPKKAEEALKRLKAENTKLVKATKDLMKAKSLTVYCKEQEKNAEKAKQTALDAIADIAEEREATSLVHIKEMKELKAASAALTKKEKSIKDKQKLLDTQELSLIEDFKLLEETKVSVDKQYTESLSIKTEYEVKLADLKERMRGL